MATNQILQAAGCLLIGASTSMLAGRAVDDCVALSIGAPYGPISVGHNICDVVSCSSDCSAEWVERSGWYPYEDVLAKDYDVWCECGNDGDGQDDNTYCHAVVRFRAINSNPGGEDPAIVAYQASWSCIGSCAEDACDYAVQETKGKPLCECR